MRICLMVEGQEGVGWKDWVDLANTAEEVGLEGLFRSDHYVSTISATTLGSLDAWATLCGLGAVTQRIRLGTMVSPATFRHPSLLAKLATTADHISGGRVELGMGAGWFEREHSTYGFDFPPANERLAMLAEQLEIVHGEWTREEFDFDGAYYSVDSVHALPKPLQKPHPPLIIGGSGGPKSIALAARWADEYNTVSPTIDEARARSAALKDALRSAGRDIDDCSFSLMTTCVVGADDDEFKARANNVLERTGNDAELDEYFARARSRRIVGTVDQVVERLMDYAGAGADRALLQHLDHTDLDMVRLLGSEVAPAVA